MKWYYSFNINKTPITERKKYWQKNEIKVDNIWVLQEIIRELGQSSQLSHSFTYVTSYLSRYDTQIETKHSVFVIATRKMTSCLMPVAELHYPTHTNNLTLLQEI